MSRKDDSVNHDRQCYDLHHDHDKRIAAVEAKIMVIENSHNDTVDEIKIKLEKSDIRFEKTFTEFTNAINGLRLDLTTFIAQTNTKTSVLKEAYPILFAIVSAGWAIYTTMHK